MHTPGHLLHVCNPQFAIKLLVIFCRGRPQCFSVGHVARGQRFATEHTTVVIQGFSLAGKSLIYTRSRRPRHVDHGIICIVPRSLHGVITKSKLGLLVRASVSRDLSGWLESSMLDSLSSLFPPSASPMAEGSNDERPLGLEGQTGFLVWHREPPVAGRGLTKA